MADIQLRSYQQILGKMVSKLLAETDLTDVAPGSVFATILEAASSSDLQSEAKLLQLLKIRNVDKAQGVDLENLAQELGVSPKRYGATQASALLTFSDTAFTKKSSTVFAGAVSPAAGDTSIKIVSGLSWNASGTIYIGRGTSSSEAIQYVSLVNSGSYWLVNLASPLTKDHLVGEEVVLGQGGDRVIPSSTICRVPPTAGNAAIEFRTLTEAVLLDGEDSLPNVSAIGTTPGSNGNVSIRKITDLASTPFSTCAVTNTFPASGGRDAETDPDLRQRVKDHVHNLAKGTQRAIIRAVVGVSDPDESKRVVSAFLREPTSAGALGILFIDDGTGFAPTFAGVGEEVIVTSAAGTEKFMQLQQFPLVKAQAVSVGEEPFNLSGGESLFFEVDNESEEKTLPTNSFRTPGVATSQEIAEAINKTFTTVEARAKNGRLFVTPASDDPEYLRVGEASNNANSVIRFPVRKQYTIRLYKNDVALEKNGLEAILQSLPSTQWPTLGTTETIQFTIDGILSPLVAFTDLDFQTYSSANAVNGATPTDWVLVISKKLIGITATSKDDGTFTLKSNRGRSDSASLEVTAGTLVGKLFQQDDISIGKAPEYKLNRLLGQIELNERLVLNDELKAGTVNTAGFVDTLKQTTFDLSLVLGSPAKMVLVTEASATNIAFDQIAGALNFTTASSGIQRITGAMNQFENVKADDWVYLYNMPLNGLYRVYRVDTTNFAFVDVFCPATVAGSDTPHALTKEVIFFRSTGLPQEVTFPSGAAVANTTVAFAINDQISGGEAQILDNDAIRLKTLRLDGSGALAIPVIVGSAKNLGVVAQAYASNDPHIAAMESGDLFGFAAKKHKVAINDLTAPFDTYDTFLTPFTAENHNRPLLTYLGAAARSIRQPKEKISSSELELRDEEPFQTTGFGPDSRQTTGSGLEVGENDNMVFIIDDDAAKKTFDVPMYVEGTVASPSVPSLTQFDANDAAADNLGTSLRWQDYRFADYRAWFRAKRDIPASVSDSGIRIKSNLFGPNGQQILFGIVYPTIANDEARASFQMDYPNSDILIDLQLSSGAQRVIGLSTNDTVEVTYTGPVSDVYTYEIRFQTPLSMATVAVGDIISITDAAFSPANLGSMKINAVTNLLDAALAYEHLSETTLGNMSVASVVDFGAVPSQAFQVGDKVTALSIRHNTTAQTSNTVDVPVGGAYEAGPGAFTINSIPFTYTSYAAGTFSGVTPDPTGLVLVGQQLRQNLTPVTYAITTVNNPQEVVTATAFPDGDGYELKVAHIAVTASGTPSFVAAVNDFIQVAGQILVITGIVSPSIFNVNTPFAFVGSQAGNISRIMVTGEKTTAGVNETVMVTSSTGVVIFQPNAGNNGATSLIGVINNTAGVKDLITASNTPGSSGAGIIATSTEEELGDGGTRVRLRNGESFVLLSENANPAFTLKEPLELAPEIGEKVRLIPMTPENVKDHFSKKQISGLSIVADVYLVNGARHVQISSKIPGGAGQVYAVGGKASGNNVFSLRNTALEISNSIGVVEVDRSVMDFLAPGHTVKLTQTGRAKKDHLGSISPATTAEIQITGLGTGKLILDEPLAAILAYTHTGSNIWVTRKLGRDRIRYDLYNGTASLPFTLKAGDFVFVGNGGSYAGVTPTEYFASANKGYFQIVETDGHAYFDVENVDGVEEFITTTSAPFVFMPYHSAMIGDQVSIDTGAPFESNNRGTYKIISIPALNEVEFANTTVLDEGPSVLGIAGQNSILILDQGFTTFRKVLAVSPNPVDPTNRALIVVEPGYDISLLNEGQNAKLRFPTRLSYGTDPVPGISGYQYWTGLKRRVQRVLDGFEPDSGTFPGVRAGGVGIEAREPQIQRVTLNIKVKTKEGVALASIADTIKSGVVGFINSLGLGQDVVLSEVVSIIQQTAGVDAVVLVEPVLDNERVVVGDNAIARTSPSDVTLS